MVWKVYYTPFSMLHLTGTYQNISICVVSLIVSSISRFKFKKGIMRLSTKWNQKQLNFINLSQNEFLFMLLQPMPPPTSKMVFQRNPSIALEEVQANSIAYGGRKMLLKMASHMGGDWQRPSSQVFSNPAKEGSKKLISLLIVISLG